MHLYSVPNKVYSSNSKPSLDDVYHHGILGMKWGKKNGPPYPLSPNAHSKGEKKAGYKKSLGGGHNENLYGRRKKVSDQQRTKSKTSEIQVDPRVKGLKKKGNKYIFTDPNTGEVWKLYRKPIEPLIDRMIQKEKEYEDELLNPWNSSSTYTSGFLNYIKDDIGKPEMADDPEMLQLLVYEYEDATGKKAKKRS